MAHTLVENPWTLSALRSPDDPAANAGSLNPEAVHNLALREALHPFATLGNWLGSDWLDSDVLHLRRSEPLPNGDDGLFLYVTAGDLRAAARALAGPAS